MKLLDGIMSDPIRIKSGRGGLRSGAGRPTLEPQARRVTLTIRVAPEVAAWLQEQPQSIGKTVDSLVHAVKKPHSS